MCMGITDLQRILSFYIVIYFTALFCVFYGFYQYNFVGDTPPCINLMTWLFFMSTSKVYANIINFSIVIFHFYLQGSFIQVDVKHGNTMHLLTIQCVIMQSLWMVFMKSSKLKTALKMKTSRHLFIMYNF